MHITHFSQVLHTVRYSSHHTDLVYIKLSVRVQCTCVHKYCRYKMCSNVQQLKISEKHQTLISIISSSRPDGFKEWTKTYQLHNLKLPIVSSKESIQGPVLHILSDNHNWGCFSNYSLNIIIYFYYFSFY